jgi:hypothetical protein
MNWFQAAQVSPVPSISFHPLLLLTHVDLWKKILTPFISIFGFLIRSLLCYTSFLVWLVSSLLTPCGMEKWSR